MSAPLIISARRVHTLDADAPPASFVAIDGDHIVGVGGPEERAAFEGPETRIADFGDATVVPGLNDSHLHPVWGLELARGMDLTDAGPLEAVRRRVAEEARRGAPWILGWGLDPNVFGPEGPSGRVFDDAAGGRPLFLRLRDAHSAVAGTAALEAAGVTGAEEFADGSEVAPGADGRPTGYLKELSAMDLVARHIPAEPVQERAGRLVELLTAMARTGLVSAHVMDFAEGTREVVELVESRGDLPIRLRFSPMVPPGASLEELREAAALQRRGGRRWHVEGAKFMIDGTVDNGTAWLERPDALGESRAPLWRDPEAFREALRFFIDRGVPTATHAIGDRAVRCVLEAIASAPPKVRARAPHRVEHVETVPDDTVAAFAELGVVAGMQPVHATRQTCADGSDNWSRRLGPERAARGWRCRDLREAGVVVALGSDWPVTPFDARAVIADTVLRRPVERPDLAPVQPDQALDMRMALEGYTTHAALAAGHERVAGRIRPGYRADLTVLGADPLACTPEELAAAPVLATVLDGRIQRHL